MRPSLMILPLAAAILACGGSSDSTGPSGGGGGGGGGGGTGPVATTAVEMKSLAFTPPAIKVAKSATVTWTNSDVGTVHNVVFDGAAAPPSGDFDTGSKSLAMPAAAATSTYKCTHHPGMSGSVLVQ